MARFPKLDSNEESEDRPSISKTLELLSDQIRQVWIEEKRRQILAEGGRATTYLPGPRLDGGSDACGRSFVRIWPKLAKFILQNKLDPVRFIRAQFERTSGKPPVSPTMLMGPVAINRYKAFVENKVDIQELQIARDSQIRAARDAIELNKRLYGPTSPDVYRDTILDANVAISSLFRYVLCIESGSYDLAQIWQDLALSQYIRQEEAYNLVWGPLIPQDLKEQANQLRGVNYAAK